MNSQSEPASVNFSWGGVLSPWEGGWCPCLEDGIMAHQQHSTTFSCRSERSTQGLVSLLVGEGACEEARTTAAQGQPTVGPEAAETGGTTGVF